jgi:hypothetical protein
MADKEELKGGISFDTTNAVTGITEMNRAVRILDTNFKAASSGIKDWTGSVSGNEAKVKSLNGIIDLQKQKVAALTAEYEKAKASSGANSTSAENLAIAVNKAQGALNKSQLELNQTTTNLKKLETEQNKQPSLWNKMATSAQGSGAKTSNALSSIKSHLSAIVGMMIGGLSIYTFKNLIDSGMEAEQTTAQLQAVLKSTGQQAGITEKSANGLAKGLSSVTTYSNDNVKSVESLLLTFTKIGKNIFPQATEATLNMATAFKEDAKSAAIQLGKALNDPIKGVTSLRRVGVQLTDSQAAMVKAMVKAGNTAGAQGVILNELAAETGNSARAAGQTAAGQYEIFKNKLKETGETIGTSLLPALLTIAPNVESMAEQVGAIVESNKQNIANAINTITETIRAVFDFVSQHWGGIVAAISGIVIAMVTWKLAVLAASIAQEIHNLALVKGALATGTYASAQAVLTTTTGGTTLATMALNSAMILGVAKFALIGAAIAAVIGIVVLLAKNHEAAAKAVSAAWEVMKGAAWTAAAAMKLVAKEIIAGLAGILDYTAGNLLQGIGSFVGLLGKLPGAVGQTFTAWSSGIAGARSAISGLAKSTNENLGSSFSEIQARAGDTSKAWAQMGSAMDTLGKGMKNTVSGYVNQVTGFFNTSSGASKKAEADAKNSQKKIQDLLGQANKSNKANASGISAGSNYAKGVGSGIKGSSSAAKAAGQKLATYVADGFSAKPFTDKINQVIKTAGTNSTEGAKKISEAVNSETKSIENNRDTAVKKLQTQLSSLSQQETSQLRTASKSQKASIENSYNYKKAVINNEISLRKAQASKEIEQIKSIGEAAKAELDKEVEDRKAFVSSVNSLESEITDALKKRYEAEGKAQEDSLNKRLNKLSKWKDEAEKEVNDYYDNAKEKAESTAQVQEDAIQKQIDALDTEKAAGDRAETLKGYTSKITDLQKQIAFSHDNYNKSQLQKQLDSQTQEYQKQVADYAREDKKTELQSQITQIKNNLSTQEKAMDSAKKSELADIEEIYNKKKDRLDKQLTAVKAYYARCEESANLEAEAEKMIMQNNQNDIIALLQSYGDAYKDAGTTLGDMLVQGFQPAIDNIKSMISSITTSIQNAKEAALEAKREASSSRIRSESSNDNRAYSVKQYIGSTKSSASENARYAENAMRRMARGLG